MDKFTRLWALEHKEFVTPSADHWTFLLVPKRDMPSRLCLGHERSEIAHMVTFLRLRASEAKRRSLYCSAFTSVLVFFSRDIPSAFVLIEGYFLRAYFSATIQTFQEETQLDALSNRVKTFRKFSTGAILLASKARNFRKFLGFLSILLFFFSQITANWPDVGTNRRKTMFSLIWWKFFYPRIIGLCEKDH